MKKSLLKAKKTSIKLLLIIVAIVALFIVVGLSKNSGLVGLTGMVGDAASFLVVIIIMSFAIFFGVPRLLKAALKR